jgi:hypothetical protein
MKHFLPILFLIVFSTILNSSTLAEEFNPFPENKGSSYEYSQDNLPTDCFFPIDKARWNGHKLLVKDWSKLTDYQKTSFISEYATVLEKQYKKEIDLEGGWKYLMMLNEYISRYGKNKKNQPMTEVLEGFLKTRGQISKMDKIWDTPFGEIVKYSNKQEVNKVLGKPHWENKTHNIWYYLFSNDRRVFVVFTDNKVIDVNFKTGSDSKQI